MIPNARNKPVIAWLEGYDGSSVQFIAEKGNGVKKRGLPLTHYCFYDLFSHCKMSQEKTPLDPFTLHEIPQMTELPIGIACDVAISIFSVSVLAPWAIFFTQCCRS